MKVLQDIPGGYYVYRDNQQAGPFAKAALFGMRQAGELPDSAYVAVDGAWVPVSEIQWQVKPVLRVPKVTAPKPVLKPVLRSSVTDEKQSALKPVFENSDAQTEDAGSPSEAQAGTAPEPQMQTQTEISQEDQDFLENVALSGKTATCPHCWHQFDMSQVNYISKHPDLLGDPIVGAGEQRRFLPTKFNAQGYAIDARGMVCNEMACPNCHLSLPLSSTELPSSMFSIVGAPASGKSYYLTSSIWMMRSTLAQKFDLSLADTDETFNAVLNNYESLLFLNNRSDQLVALPKTEVAGADYTNQVTLKGIVTDLPKPFIFTLMPSPSHPLFGQEDSTLQRNIVLYDNGGEHFEPGRDSVNNPSTHHLIHSDGIVFLYDPMKDIRLAKQCSDDDPQKRQTQYKGNQMVLLNEMISRIRKYSGLNSREKYNKMLVLVIPKYDAWRKEFPFDLEKTEFAYYSSKEMRYFLDIGSITSVSFALREMLLKYLPDLVATCETFFSTVFFLPTSALGRVPEYDEKTESIGIHPEHLKPIWAEVPMLLQFWYANLVDGVVTSPKDSCPIENYKFNGDSLIYSLPGLPGRFSVPSNYWGRTVYSNALGRNITFPNAPETQEMQTASGASADPSGAADDFWNN